MRTLVTGGTGSFGNRVAVTLLARGDEVTVFSRDEKKQWEQRKRFPGIRYVIGDTRDYPSVYEAMRGQQFVFHAAALKQVPNCEDFPLEAVKTNVLGSDNVFRAAAERGVSRVVALSTDKAVMPANAMGATKMLMERTAQAWANRSVSPIVSLVRYGNVLGSRGSVVPVFAEQISSGGPVTITDPGMTRFLLTLDDAVELVLHALEFGEPGDVHVMKAPACRVDLLAKACWRFYGGYGKFQSKTIGIRPGEKMHETLVSTDEMWRTSDEGKFFVVGPSWAGRLDKPLGPAYTSDETVQLTKIEDVIKLLKKADSCTGELT